MDTQSKVFIQVGDEILELTGDKLTAFESDRKAFQARQNTLEAEINAKSAARESALAKLAALGLTEEEIEAL